jgi:hypothetical protein
MNKQLNDEFLKTFYANPFYPGKLYNYRKNGSIVLFNSRRINGALDWYGVRNRFKKTKVKLPKRYFYSSGCNNSCKYLKNYFNENGFS